MLPSISPVKALLSPPGSSRQVICSIVSLAWILALALVVFAEKVLPYGQRACFDQLVDVSIIEGVGAEIPHGLVQLGGEFDARCPGPDDGAVKLSSPNGGLAPDRDRHADPKAPYKANLLSLSRATQPILNMPVGVTVLTRQVLDDMNATTLRDALRNVAGVTVR